MEKTATSAALCLAGGNALGAYQAGFCEALVEAGFDFPVIAGTSVGAVVGALVAGNAPPDRADALRRFWQAACMQEPAWQSMAGLGGRRLTLLRTLFAGHARLFRPGIPGPLSAMAGVDTGRSLYTRLPMRELLHELVDFDRLGRGPSRLMLTAIDAETGQLVTFDTAHDIVTVDHLLAATAFPLLFEPVQIAGRWLIDAGLRCNLPLDLLPEAAGGLPCIAVDLFTLAGPLPDTLTAMAARTQDILLAGQSADAIARYRANAGNGPLFYQSYANPADQTATKTLDFSSRMLAQRRDRGLADAAELIRGWPTAR